MDDHLIHGESAYPVSMTLVTAVLLLALGLVAAASVVFDVSLLG
jgi:putative membrane protein